MEFPNLVWAIAQAGPQYRFAKSLGENESWLSRRLTGRVEFTQEDCEKIARALGYPADWLFQTPTPPSRQTIPQLEPAGAHV
jgi:transcriptional regulator with XRE-family HTH domain